MEDENKTPIVHVTRSLDPIKPILSAEVIRKHERSKSTYPHLNLSEGEYVIVSVGRHPIGLIGPQVAGAILVAILLTVATSYQDMFERIGILPQSGIFSLNFVVGICWLFLIVVILGMISIAHVYVSNRFYLTNESVIQEIRYSLFSKHEQTVSLANIEDASFNQKGILQHIFNYGSVRLSTEGDETTYRFSYVSNPKAHVARLNNVVEAFKNGRPIEDD